MSAITRGAGGGGHDSARWGVSFVVVCALHVAAAVAILSNPIMFVPAEAPPDAVLIDLAPLPKPAVAAPTPAPPPEPRKIEEPPPPTSPPEAVTLPKPPPPKPRPPQPERVVREPPPRPAAIATSAKIEPAPTLAKPVVAAAPNAMPAWEMQILARLEKFKRYPRRAQLRQQEGTAYLRFTLSRNGDVIAYALQRSSGIDLLDEETLSLIERAKPFPPAPTGLGRDKVELVVPVRFTLR